VIREGLVLVVGEEIRSRANRVKRTRQGCSRDGTFLQNQ
jgi:hypothetical protein